MDFFSIMRENNIPQMTTICLLTNTGSFHNIFFHIKASYPAASTAALMRTVRLRSFPVRSLTDPVLSDWAIRFQIMFSLKDTLTLKCCGEFSLSLNNWSVTGIVKLNEFYSLLDIIRSHFNFQGRLYDK